MQTEISLKSNVKLGISPMESKMTSSSSLLASSLCFNRLLTENVEPKRRLGQNLNTLDLTENSILMTKKRPLPSTANKAFQFESKCGVSFLENNLIKPKMTKLSTISPTNMIGESNWVHSNAFNLTANLKGNLRAVDHPSPKTLVDTSGLYLDDPVAVVPKKFKLEQSNNQTDISEDEEKENLSIFLPEIDDLMESTHHGEDSLHDQLNSVTDKKKIRHNQNMAIKRDFVQFVSASLISSPNFKNPLDESRKALVTKAVSIAIIDPEFILKMATYTRLNLNIRSTGNFLLAFAAKTPPCRPFLRKYFNVAVRLPSDWIEIVELCESLISQDGMQMKNRRTGRTPIPTALRIALTEKFEDFDEYQLGKHNKQKKSNKRKRKTKDVILAKKSKADSDDGESDEGENEEAPDQSKGPSGTHLTLKKVIRTCHISRPAQFVMAILGKKYPADPVAFSRSGLPGIFCESNAGKRMKLAIPETWETQISAKGNKAAVWESLLDNKKLPFMAMLRNLRNMLRAGISAKHHDSVIRRLKDEKSVIGSRQFPFRFFSAYEVLDELRNNLKSPVKKPKVLAQKAKKYPKKPWWETNRDKKRARELLQFDEKLLDRYQKALDSAVKIASTHNIQPIPGRTVVLANVDLEEMSATCTSAKGLGKPRTAQEIAVLLSLMCQHCCEDVVGLIYNQQNIEEMKVTKGTILENMATVLEQSHEMTGNGSVQRLTTPIEEKLEKFLIDRKRIDNLIVLTHQTGPEDAIVHKFLLKYRQIVNANLLYVNISLSANRPGVKAMEEINFEDNLAEPVEVEDRNIYLSGFSDQILRFVAERGNAGQMTFIDQIDKTYELLDQKKLKKTTRQIKLSHDCQKLAIPPLYPSALRSVTKCLRVFISSTFKDFHGERDVLARFVQPELKRKVLKTFGLNLEFVDLRWGLTSEQSITTSNVELCLREVNKSQLFVGLLGSRYGHIPPNYNVSDPKEFAWLSDYPQDRSVTELEIVNFVFNPANKTDKARRRSLFYFRDGKFPSKVPPQWREDFSSEDLTALGKLTALKRRIHQANMRVKENYPCEWGGIREGKPIAAGLTVFAQSVLTDLWSAVKSYHQDEFESDTEMANRSDKNVYIPELTNWRFAYGEVEKFAGRKKLLSEAIGHLKKFPGGILLLTGTSGVGKTSVAAKLATESRKFSLVVTSFAHIQPELSSLNNILTHLANSIAANLTQLNVDIDVDLDAIRQNEVELSKFLEIIRLIAIKLPLAIVLDGYNSGVINPLLEAKLVPNVNLVVSSLEGSPCAACACRIAGTKQLRLGGLELADRPEVIRRLLLGSGKALGESAFDGQLRLLTSKRDADKPAYLQIACEYLRVSGDHQKLTAQIRAMPSALPNLVRSVVGQLDMDFGANLVRDSLIFLTLGEGQLSRTDLFNLVDIFQQASNSAEVNWSIEEIGKSSQRLPQSTFVLLMNSLNAVLREVQNGLDEPNVQFVSQSITDLMIKTKLIPSSPKNPERKYLQALIAYFASLCESQSRRHDNVVDRKIPALLVKFLVRLGDWARLAHFLCSLDFVELCFKLGAVGALIPVYQICSTQLSVKLASLKKSKSLKVDEDVEFLIRRLDDFNQFVNENLSLLTVYPTLIGQQAINQPVSSEVYCLAVSQYLVKIARSPLGIRWENRPPPKDDFKPNCYRTIRLGVELTCVAVDLKGHFVAVGSSDAQLRLFDFQSGSEIFNFVGHSQAITSVSFLDANGLYLCSCGADGNIFVWNTSELSKLVSLKGHTGVVSCCRPFKWSKVANLVTVGWDKTIRLWNFLNGKLVEEISTDSPISTFDLQPETQFIATGHWDSTVKIYSLAPIARKAVLRGHHSSVRSVAYNRDGQQIISACRDGQVRLWSAKFGCQLGSILAAHSLPVSQLTFLLDSNTFATAGEDSTLKLWASQLGQPVMTINLPVHDQMVDVDRITSVLIGPEGKSLLVGHGEGNIRHYNVELKSELQHIKIRPAAMILSMKRFGPTAANNPMDLVMVATNISASIVSLKSGKVPFTLDSGGYCPISSADVGGDLVATGHSDGSVRLYDVTAAKWKKQNSITPAAVFYGHEGLVSGCAFNGGFNLLLATVGVDKTLNIWSLAKILNGETNEPSRQAKFCHSEAITSVCWSHSRNLLITASLDCQVKIWRNLDATGSNLDNEAEIPQPQAADILTHPSAVMAVDLKFGCVVTTAKDGYIRVWSHKGVLITQLSDKTDDRNSEPTCCSLYFEDQKEAEEEIDWAAENDKQLESTGKKERISASISNLASKGLVAVGFTSGVARIWQPFEAEQLSSLQSHSGPVWGVSGAAGNKLVTCGLDGSLKWWDLNRPVSSTQCYQGHFGPVNALAVDRKISATIVYTGGQDGLIGCWTTTIDQSDNDTFTWKSHRTNVSSLVVMPEDMLVSSGEDQYVRLWKIDITSKKAELLTEYHFQSPVSCISMQFASNSLAVSVGLWNGELLEAVLKLNQIPIEPTSEEKSLDWIKMILPFGDAQILVASKKIYMRIRKFTTTLMSLDSNFTFTYVAHINGYFLTGLSNGEIRLYNADFERQTVIKAHQGKVVGIQPFMIGGNSNYFLSASTDRLVKIWKFGSGARMNEIKLAYLWESPVAISSVASSDGKFWIGDSIGQLFRCRLEGVQAE